MNNETIKRSEAIEAIKALHNILGDAGTKAAVMALESVPAVGVQEIDYTNKCGTCEFFERYFPYRRGWCHKQPYGNDVVHDEEHPFRTVNMGRVKCPRYAPKED